MNLSNACRPFSYTAHEFFFAQNHGIGRNVEASSLVPCHAKNDELLSQATYQTYTMAVTRVSISSLAAEADVNGDRGIRTPDTIPPT